MFLEPFNLALNGASILCSLLIQLLTGNFTGKLDVAPAYVHISVVESSKTVQKLDMPAFRGEFDIYYNSGLSLRPAFTYSTHNGRLWAAGITAGFSIPFFQRIIVTPLGGVNFLGLKSKVPLPEFLVRDVKRGFRSVTGVAGGELTLVITPCLRISGQYLYGWARTHASIKDFFKTKASSSGSIYSGQIEYNFTPNFSVNVGVCDDLSLSKEKHGLRVFGVKTGVCFWF